MTRRRSSILQFTATIIAIVLVAIAAPTAFADQEGTGLPYTATTPDGKHIFRMLASYEVGAPYPSSGMYLNDGSTVPLWTVDWNAFAFVPSGGQYLVRKGNWAPWSGTYREEALTFFSNGQPLKTYTTAELIDFPWLLPHTVSHYGWQPAWTPSERDDYAALTHAWQRYSNASVKFDDENQRVYIVTLLGDRFTFDLRTGEIVSVNRSRAVTTLLMFAVLLLIYGAWRIMYPTTGSSRPLIGPSNLLMGAVFTFSLVVIPTTAAQFFRVVDASEGDSYAYFVRLGFETLARYVVALFGFHRPELTPTGSALVVCFWLACVAAFTVVDRFVVSLVERVRRTNS